MKLIQLLSIILLMAFLSVGIQADDKIHSITIDNAISYPTSETQKNGVVFMTIHNTTPIPDKIIAAYADTVADHVELHTHVVDGDRMVMKQIEAYDIPAGEIVTLEPAGHHIMLMGLKHPLKEGDTFMLTLDLEREADITTTITVGHPAP